VAGVFVSVAGHTSTALQRRFANSYVSTIVEKVGKERPHVAMRTGSGAGELELTWTRTEERTVARNSERDRTQRGTGSRNVALRHL
jgi:hypothetical protein